VLPESREPSGRVDRCKSAAADPAPVLQLGPAASICLPPTAPPGECETGIFTPVLVPGFGLFQCASTFILLSAEPIGGVAFYLSAVKLVSEPKNVSFRTGPVMEGE
jgi:hypothetical protein